MSESLPVVTSNCNSLERMVVEHNVGLVFESENAEDLASKVDALLSDNSKRISYGENGKLAAESIFNWHSTIHPLINYYNKLTVS
jgi:glycosyltransferase involved in cell wall biosynthesis